MRRLRRLKAKALHLPGRVAIARGAADGERLGETAERIGSQFEVDGGDVGVEPGAPLVRDGDDVVALGSSQASATWAGWPGPRGRPLRGLRSFSGCGRCFPGEARMGAATVSLDQVAGLADGASQKTAAERRIGDEADTQFPAGRQDFRLDVARPQRILGLETGQRMDGVARRSVCGPASESPMWRTLPAATRSPWRRRCPRWRWRDRPGAGSKDRCDRCPAAGGWLRRPP